MVSIALRRTERAAVQFLRPKEKRLLSRRELLVPLLREIFDLLGPQDRLRTVEDDCRSLALFNWEHHRSRHRGAELHASMVGQGNHFVRVKGHFTRPLLEAGSTLRQHTRPRCPIGG